MEGFTRARILLRPAVVGKLSGTAQRGYQPRPVAGDGVVSVAAGGFGPVKFCRWLLVTRSPLRHGNRYGLFHVFIVIFAFNSRSAAIRRSLPWVS